LRTGLLQVAFVDAVLLIFAYFVYQDLDWRNSFAASHGYAPSTSYSLLTRTFTLTGKGTTLQSPPTLDWIQVVVALLIVINLVYAFEAFRGSQVSKATPSERPGA
jgi:hypothetical protein